MDPQVARQLGVERGGDDGALAHEHRAVLVAHEHLDAVADGLHDGSPDEHARERAARRQRAEAIVKATTFFDDPDMVAKVSRGLGEAMRGDDARTVPTKLAERGW